MPLKRACLQHIYNTGVNLAWAQVFTQNNAIEAALFNLQGQLRDYCCNVRD